MGSDSSSGAPGGKMTSDWASPAIIGLLAFGMTIILFGLANLPKPYGNGFVGFAGIPATETLLGGLILVLAGIIGLLKGHTYWGSAFLGYGAFWLSAASGAVTLTGVGAHGYGGAGFMFIWLLFTLTFLISSMKHGWGTFFFLLFLFVGFALLIVEFWQTGAANKISSGEMWAVGGEWIFTGVIAWYAGTADLTNHTYGRKVLPI
jgi:uncharacterized protein